jgi:hypothetical protein
MSQAKDNALACYSYEAVKQKSKGWKIIAITIACLWGIVPYYIILWTRD